MALWLALGGLAVLVVVAVAAAARARSSEVQVLHPAAPPRPGGSATPGAPVVPLSSDDDAVLTLARAGRTIDAIKLFREQTGAGLKECKDAVEALLEGQAPPRPAGALPGWAEGADLQSEVRALLDKGLTIEAIKLYRVRTGLGLKEAKDAVEALANGPLRR
jgi:ribosomal protein L7/L12